MDLIGNSSNQPLSPGDIVAEFCRREPAVAAAFGPLAETPSDTKQKVEEYLAEFLLQASRVPAFDAREARRLVHHEASRNAIIVGELSCFPDRYEPAICDTGRLIWRQERAGKGPVKDLALYLLARIARLYRIEAESRDGIPEGAFDPARHMPKPGPAPLSN